MVVPGTCWGRPAATQAFRATLVDCSPTWLTQPPITSSIWPGSTPVRLDQVLQREGEQIDGCQLASAPPLRPNAVRVGVDDHRLALFGPCHAQPRSSVVGLPILPDLPVLCVGPRAGAPAHLAAPGDMRGQCSNFPDSGVRSHPRSGSRSRPLEGTL